jgi:hypothetical protein
MASAGSNGIVKTAPDATIDVQAGPGDERGIFGGKEDGSFRHFPRLGDSLQRVHLGEFIELLGLALESS